MVVSDEAKTDILQRDQKGLFKGSEVSMWDPMKKMKLRTFSTWMTKKRVHVSEQVYKLREERNLLQRILLIQRSRSHSLPPLEKIIGDFELAACVNDEDDPTACVGANAGDNILESSTKAMITDTMGVVEVLQSLVPNGS